MNKVRIRLGKVVGRTFLIGAMTFGLVGCTPDLVEVDAINMVLALGIDQVGNQVRVSAEIVLAQGAQGGVQQQQQASQYLVKESTADSIETAVEKLNTILPRRLFLPHNTIVIFGRSYAEHGISRAFDYLERDRAYRRNQILLVSQTDARDILQQNMPPESINALGLRQLVEQSSDMSQMLNSQQLRVMREYLQASHSEILTAICLGKDKKPRVSGVGVFQGGKLATFLNTSQTEGLIWHMANTRGVVMDVPCKNGGQDEQATFRLLTTHTGVQPSIHNGTVSVRYVVRGRGEVLRVCENTQLDRKTFAQMEKLVAKDIQACMERTMTILQENQVDGAEVGNRLFQAEPQKWRTIAKNWNETFGRAKVTYDVKIHIIRSGLSASEPSLEYTPEQFPPKAGKEPKVK